MESEIFGDQQIFISIIFIKHDFFLHFAKLSEFTVQMKQLLSEET